MWWAHSGFTRINIELTILTNGIEEHPNIWNAYDFLATSAMRRAGVVVLGGQKAQEISYGLSDGGRD
jgi:hypothetical protein